MSQEVQLAAEAVQEVTHVAEATGGLGTLGINLKIFIAQLVNFVVVLLVLWKFAYKPIVDLLDKRAKKVEESVKQAEHIEKRVQEIEDEQHEVIAKAKSEASQILEKGREDAEKQKTAFIAKTKDEVAQVVQKGKEQLKNEKEQMIREAKEDIVKIAVAASEKILKETVDKDKSNALAKEVVDKMS
jgi:F-type H+-transporting ATPase subunit b